MMGCPKPGGRGRPTVPARALRKVPPPNEQAAPGNRGSREGRQGRRNDTGRVARMIRLAMTLTRDLVRRRLPAGASPSGRETAPGRTLSPMPSEQKGAYGGHLASSVLTLQRTVPCGGTYVPESGHPSGL